MEIDNRFHILIWLIIKIEIHIRLFVVVFPDPFIQLIADAFFGNEVTCSASSKATLVPGVYVGISPGFELVDFLFGGLQLFRALGVHIDAIGTAVDQRNAQFDQFASFLSMSFSRVIFQGHHVFHRLWRYLEIIDPIVHFHPSRHFDNALV